MVPISPGCHPPWPQLVGARGGGQGGSARRTRRARGGKGDGGAGASAGPRLARASHQGREDGGAELRTEAGPGVVTWQYLRHSKQLVSRTVPF